MWAKASDIFRFKIGTCNNFFARFFPLLTKWSLKNSAECFSELEFPDVVRALLLGLGLDRLTNYYPNFARPSLGIINC